MRKELLVAIQFDEIAFQKGWNFGIAEFKKTSDRFDLKGPTKLFEAHFATAWPNCSECETAIAKLKRV